MNEFELKDLSDAINTIVYYAHRQGKAGGWWDNVNWDDPHVQAVKVGLIAGEAHEAIEGIRTDSQDKHLPQHKEVLTELIDVFIRTGDTLGRYIQDDPTINPGQIAVDKILYNAARADHKPENRKKTGGKRF